jgi:hypothetical protein
LNLLLQHLLGNHSLRSRLKIIRRDWLRSHHRLLLHHVLHRRGLWVRLLHHLWGGRVGHLLRGYRDLGRVDRLQCGLSVIRESAEEAN